MDKKILRYMSFFFLAIAVLSALAYALAPQIIAAILGVPAGNLSCNYTPPGASDCEKLQRQGYLIACLAQICEQLKSFSLAIAVVSAILAGISYYYAKKK
jgi:hypothetical protein